MTETSFENEKQTPKKDDWTVLEEIIKPREQLNQTQASVREQRLSYIKNFFKIFNIDFQKTELTKDSDFFEKTIQLLFLPDSHRLFLDYDLALEYKRKEQPGKQDGFFL